jgi:hypothetical protein
MGGPIYAENQPCFVIIPCVLLIEDFGEYSRRPVGKPDEVTMGPGFR